MTGSDNLSELRPLQARHTSIDWSVEPDLEALRRARALLKTDKAQALRELAPLAERGSLVAMNFLGGCYSVGDTVPKDIERAEALFRRASDAGSIEGTYKLGLLMRREGDFSKAVGAFIVCAAVEYVPGMDKLGIMYLKGEGIEPDTAKARALWERASAKGNLWARRHLASLLLSGRCGVGEIPRGLRLLASAMIGAAKIADPDRPTDLLR
jgi:TPR repeat protein